MAITIRDTEDVFAHDDYAFFLKNEIETTRIYLSDCLSDGADLGTNIAI